MYWNDGKLKGIDEDERNCNIREEISRLANEKKEIITSKILIYPLGKMIVRSTMAHMGKHEPPIHILPQTG